jgi:hypothetical protein
MNHRTKAARQAAPPTVTRVGFETDQEVSAQAPDVGGSVEQVTAGQMASVLQFFAGLELEFPGNLSPSQIHDKILAEAPERMAAEFGSTWSAAVDSSQPVGNQWSGTGSTFVHPTKSDGAIYTHASGEYALPSIKAVRIT